MANPSVDALSSAYYHTRRILFCPFEPRKYLKFALIYLLAGGAQGGPRGSYQFPLPKHHEHSGMENGTASAAQNCFAHAQSFIKTSGSGDYLQGFLAFVQNWKNRIDSILHSHDTGFMAICVLLTLGAVVLSFGLIYVISVFQFIFLDSIVSNKVSIRDHWRKHKGLGFSYMMWMLVIIGIMLAVMAACFLPLCLNAPSTGGISSGAFMGSFCVVMLVAGALIILLAIVAGFTVNLAVPVMFIRNISILPAWSEVLRLARSNIGEFLLYCVIQVGIAVAFCIAAFIVAILVMLVTGVLFGVPALIVYLIIKSAIAAASTAIIVLAGIWIALAIIFFISLATAAMLPAGVFLKSYNLCFLGMLNQDYRVMFSE
ncbi:MAG: hypothetical protein AB9903_15885 [Vulcanimicrobiota bacterium]